MTQNNSHDHIRMPQSHDTRVSGLIVRSPVDAPTYGELNPITHGGAPPLDPNLLKYGDKPYEAHCIDSNEALVREVVARYRLTEQQALRLSAEVKAELSVRCGHNDDAMRTLCASLDESPADEDILEIIHKARESAATPAELRELLEQHPEMVAVGVADFLKPFDAKAHAMAAALHTRLARLIFKKPISEVSGVELIPETGALIVKRIIGRDEPDKPGVRAQMRMKQIFFATPRPGMSDLDDVPLSRESMKDGIIWRVISTQAYFCVDDYRDRYTYHRERDALQIGQEELTALHGLRRIIDK